MRWMGHRLHADLHISVKPELNTIQGHELAEEVRISFFKAMPLLSEAIVHVEPWSPDPDEFHHRTSGREPVPRPIEE
jgi:divalent metal cation (Fe/Co/Zn/Cd) transporter